MNHKLTSIAAALVIVIAVFFALNRGGVPIDGASIAWADVVKQFRAVRSLEVTMYFKENAVATAEQIELWVNENGKARMRNGNKVIFAENGLVTAAFDTATKKKVEPEDKEIGIAKMLGSVQEFSLDTMLAQMLLAGKLENVTPQVNLDENISSDITVFDLTSEEIRQWIRIWALNESKLPARIKTFDPENGGDYDFIFTYSKTQPDSFYDALVYAKFIQGKNAPSGPMIVYYGMKDPLEKEVAPNIRSDNKMMNIVTTTLDGQPWSMAEQLQDKKVVLFFWSLSRGNFYAKEIENTFLKYLKDSDDVVFASVILTPDANAVKKYIKDHNIPGLHLHEPGKGFNNSLAAALGVNNDGVAVLIDRYGNCISRAGSPTIKEMLDYIINGANYETSTTITCMVNEMKNSGKDVTKNMIEQLIGGKETAKTIDMPGGKTVELWSYSFVNKENTIKRILSFQFDDSDICSSHGYSTIELNQAKITVKISKNCWNKILSEFDAWQLPDNNPANEFDLRISKSGQTDPDRRTEQQIGPGFPLQGIEPDIVYKGEAKPDTYDILLPLIDKNKFTKLSYVILKTNVVLEVGKTVELVIDDIPAQTKQP